MHEKEMKITAKVTLGHPNQGKSFGIILSEELLLSGYPSDEYTKITIVNNLGCDPEGSYWIDFYGIGSTKEALEELILDFIKRIFFNLKMKIREDEYMLALSENDEDELPTITHFAISDEIKK